MVVKRSTRGTGEDRRQAVNVKIHPALRAKLDKAAQVAGRTLSHEIETRLAESVEGTGSPETDDLLNILVEAIKHAENRPSKFRLPSNNPVKPWHTDKEVRVYARRAMLEIIRVLMGEDESEQNAVLRRSDGTEIEDFDYGRAIAHMVLMSWGKLDIQPPPAEIARQKASK